MLLLLAWLNIFFSNCRNLFQWQCYFIKRWILLLISQHATRDTSVMGVKKPPAKDRSLGLKKIVSQWLGDNWQLRWRYVGSSSDNMFWCNIGTCFCLLSSWLTADSTRAVPCITMYAIECCAGGTIPHLFLPSLVSCTAFTRHRVCVFLKKNAPSSLPIHDGLNLMLSLNLDISVNFLLLVICLIWTSAFLLSLGARCFYGQKSLTNWIPGDIFPNIVGKSSLKTNKKIIESSCFQGI